jgi:periplasmic protein TonB
MGSLTLVRSGVGEGKSSVVRQRLRASAPPTQTRVRDATYEPAIARLPSRTIGQTLVQGSLSAALHLLALTVTVSMMSRTPPPRFAEPATRSVEPAQTPLPRLVFLAPRDVGGGGGGGGGNRSSLPIRHAEARGHDDATLGTRQIVEAAGTAPPSRDEPPQAILLDARPLASGDSVHAGLPVGGVSYGTSTGPGSGGGVGTGSGTGIGPGRGPGVGPGTGGGTGGGVYRPGGSVTTPRLLVQVDPRYTSDALDRKIQGAVWLELVVARSGTPTDIRVVRSLDPGLDDEAMKALRQWRFTPGMLAGSPVDVQVVVVMDFRIH